MKTKLLVIMAALGAPLLAALAAALVQANHQAIAGTPNSGPTLPIVPAGTSIPKPADTSPTFRVRFSPARWRSYEIYTYDHDLCPNCVSSLHSHPQVREDSPDTLTVTLTDDRNVAVRRVILNGRTDRGCSFEPQTETARLKTGESINIQPDCGDIIKVEIDTDQGDVLYTMEDDK